VFDTEFQDQPIRGSDITIATVVFALTLVNVGIAIYLGYGQTQNSRSPLRSVYVWLIWLELLVSTLMGFECYLHLLKVISASQYAMTLVLYVWLITFRLRFLLYYL
jgi:hypothetical protein